MPVESHNPIANGAHHQVTIIYFFCNNSNNNYNDSKLKKENTRI